MYVKKNNIKKKPYESLMLTSSKIANLFRVGVDVDGLLPCGRRAPALKADGDIFCLAFRSRVKTGVKGCCCGIEAVGLLRWSEV